MRWWVSKPKLYHSGYIVGMTLAGMSYKYKAPFGMVCSNNGGCCCQLCILRAVSTLYSVLKTLLNYVYTARRSHLGFVSIDKALGAGDFHSLMQNTRLTCRYLRKVNDVLPSYIWQGKLCTEIQYQESFHASFTTLQWKETISTGRKSTRLEGHHTTRCFCGYEMHQSLVRTSLTKY